MNIDGSVHDAMRGVHTLTNSERIWIKKLVNSLKKFEDEINQFKMKNRDAEGVGFTHLHLAFAFIK